MCVHPFHLYCRTATAGTMSHAFPSFPVPSSSSSSCDHNISLDGIVRAQRWLRGYVSIKLSDKAVRVDNSDNRKDDTVKIELEGKEITKSKKESEKTMDVFHEESTRRVMFPVLEANRQYRFPFSIYTPGSIAPSMDYSDPKDPETFCRIEFLLVASFQSHTAERKIHIVGQPLSSKPYPVTVVPSVVPIITKSFSWKNMLELKPRHRQSSSKLQHHHGCLIWAACLKNTHVGKGDEGSFSFSLRNCSSYDVIKLSAKLIEKISWKTNQDTQSESTELAYVLMTNLSFLDNQRSSLSRHQSQLVPIDHELEQIMQEELVLQENTVAFQVPPKCRDSYKGRLIQVSHHLLIEARTCDTHGKEHTATMTMEIPVKVFDPPVLEHHHHHHHLQQGNPADIADRVMAKWPGEKEDESHASFTSFDDNSLDSAVSFPHIQEEK